MANGWASVVNWREIRRQSLFLSPWASTNCPCPPQRSRAPSRSSCPSSLLSSRETTTGPVLAKGRFCYYRDCLLYTSDAADDLLCVDLGGRRIIKKTNN